MKKNILPVLILLILQTSILAQEDTTFHTTFEIQGGIGIVNLLGYKGGVLEMDDLNSYSKSITDINHSGKMVQFGLIISRRLRKNFWLQSGLQATYLEAKADYLLQENFEDGITSLTTSKEIEIESFGLQMPILFEYRYNFETWGFYSSSGFVLSYSYPDINRQGIFNFTSSNHVEQYGVAGTFGVGVLLNQRNWSSWRFGYRLSADLVPFNRGNNTRDKIYHPENEADRDYRHLMHQLDFSFILPEREIVRVQSFNDNRWTGLFLGTSLSFQIPFKDNDLAGRKGIGWGRNLQLKWIASRGFGLRLQHGIWIAPASDNRTKTWMTKAELLYQLPFGLEITSGIAFRDETDVVFNGGGSYKGILLGTGGMIPLNLRFGLQLDFSGHYIPKYEGEKFLLDAGIGLVFNVF